MRIKIEDLQDSGVARSVADWFKPHEESFVRFAHEHNLAVGKYLKDIPAWHFFFTHPRGGEGRIDMIRRDQLSFTIRANWHKDDYDQGTRSIKWLEIWDAIAPGELLKRVEGTLQAMLSWTPDDFEQTATGYSAMWHQTWTKETFEKNASRHPIPRCE